MTSSHLSELGRERRGAEGEWEEPFEKDSLPIGGKYGEVNRRPCWRCHLSKPAASVTELSLSHGG